MKNNDSYIACYESTYGCIIWQGLLL